MRTLTDRQRMVLEAIREFTDRWGYPPSVRELCRALGVRSTSTVHTHLIALQKKGYISRSPFSPRTVVIKSPAGEGDSSTAPPRSRPWDS